MNRYILNLLFTLIILIPLVSSATTFFPLPLDKQLSNAYGVVHGTFQGSTFKKLGTGEVVTTASIKVIQTAGLKTNEIINYNDLKVSYPGGVWEGLVYNVPGAPTFQKGEEVVLLVSKGSRGFTINNLKMGKYEIYFEDGQKFIGSSAFRGHKRLGRIKFTDFQSLVDQKFNQPMSNVHHDKFIHIAKNEGHKEEGRSPASVENMDEKVEPKSSIGIFWLMLFFALIGSYATFIKKKR